MQLNNPFQMNDWEIGKFLNVVIGIQLALWGTIGLDFVGLQIPIIRQLIGFIYLKSMNKIYFRIKLLIELLKNL